MHQSTPSNDGSIIHYTTTGKSRTALLFIHGWMGNGTWWDAQRAFFAERYQVVTMDLAGHGQSSKNRQNWSVEAYAADIKAVADCLEADKIILIGHSMSGSNVVAASAQIPKTAAIIFVDTLHDLDQMMTIEKAQPFLDMLKTDFRGTVQNVMPQFLFAKTSPQAIVAQLSQEFLQVDPALSVAMLVPFYATDIRPAAKRLGVAVASINSDLYPTNVEVNRRYFPDFQTETIAGVGHYPMLENPDEFNRKLALVLDAIV